jgi:Trk K+ transport system NAD-binding subunit
MAAGKNLSDIQFPNNIVISAVLRDGQLIIPRGDTILRPRDEVIALATRESEPALRQMLIG